MAGAGTGGGGILDGGGLAGGGAMDAEDGGALAGGGGMDAEDGGALAGGAGGGGIICDVRVQLIPLKTRTQHQYREETCWPWLRC